MSISEMQAVINEAACLAYVNQGYPKSFTESSEYKIARGSRSEETDNLVLAKALLQSLNEQKIIDSGKNFDRESFEKLCSSKRSLRLSRKDIFSLPSFVLKFFKTISQLEFNGSGIRKIPDEMAELQNLTTLKIVNADCLMALGSLKALSNVKELVISECCNFTDLPEGRWENSKLEKCTIDDCTSFKRIPENFFEAPNLKECRFNITQVDKLPEIPQGSKLEILEVTGGGLRSVPNSIENAESLKRFDIGDNPFEEIPEVVKKLKQLEYLGLGEYEEDTQEPKPKITDLSSLSKLKTLVVPKGWFEKTQDLAKYLPKVFAVEEEKLTKQEGLNITLECKGTKRTQKISGKAEKKFKKE